jgi:hypothetical protein
MAEESRNAAKTAPLGVITSVGASAVFGFFYLAALLFSIQDFDATLNSEVGQPVLQIFVDVFGKTGASAAFGVIIVAVTLCGTFSVTSNSRMFYAFSRDGALPKFFNHVEKRTAVPVRTVWLAIFFAFVLALPSLGSSIAFTAVTSIATIVRPLPISPYALAPKPAFSLTFPPSPSAGSLYLLRHPHLHPRPQPQALQGESGGSLPAWVPLSVRTVLSFIAFFDLLTSLPLV